MNDDDVLTTFDLAVALKLSPRTLEGWRANGRGPKYIPVSTNRVLYRWGAVRSWLESQETEPQEAAQ